MFLIAERTHARKPTLARRTPLLKQHDISAPFRLIVCFCAPKSKAVVACHPGHAAPNLIRPVVFHTIDRKHVYALFPPVFFLPLCVVSGKHEAKSLLRNYGISYMTRSRRVPASGLAAHWAQRKHAI